MRKKVLAIYYTQSGQLEEIIDHFTEPLNTADVSVEKLRIYPRHDYALPWNGERFFAVMPECVRGIPIEMQPYQFKEDSYDLIIFGYQAWFLSPSLPANSLLNDPAFQALLKDTPVITITGARNMWISAMERIKKSLKDSGARLVGNIAQVDKHHNLISFITIFYWMFTGRKERYLNLFPKPGVSDDDISHAAVYGNTVLDALKRNNWDGLQDSLLKQGAVVIKYNLMFIESKARRIFALWAAFIVKRKKRTAWLVAFKYYLLIALFIAATIILTVDAIFFNPFLSGRIKRQKHYYSGVN
jgi:hypothetical protein